MPFRLFHVSHLETHRIEGRNIVYYHAANSNRNNSHIYRRLVHSSLRNDDVINDSDKNTHKLILEQFYK